MDGLHDGPTRPDRIVPLGNKGTLYGRCAAFQIYFCVWSRWHKFSWSKNLQWIMFSRTFHFLMLRLCRWRGCQGVFFLHWQGQLTLLQHLPSWLHPLWIISCTLSAPGRLRISLVSWQVCNSMVGKLNYLNSVFCFRDCLLTSSDYWVYIVQASESFVPGIMIGMMIGQDLLYLLRCALRFHMRSIVCNFLRQRVWVSRKLRWTGFRWWRLCPGFTELGTTQNTHTT